MLDVKPFRGIRFSPARLGRDVSALIAPPYDVVDEVQKAQLLAQHPNNIVSIDLPHMPPKNLGPQEAYDAAARRFREALSDGVFVQDAAPCIYLYHQCFHYGDILYTRKMLLLRVRLYEFSAGVVLPHELTFGGPKEDRLALMKATQCNLSPVFSIFSDPRGEILQRLAATEAQQPAAFGRLDEVENRLWVIDDAQTIADVVGQLGDKQLYIADGHHRYGTALQYRQWLSTQQGGAPLAEDHPANFVMMALASMDDPGSLILPYHRALVQIDAETVAAAWSVGTAAAAPSAADITLVDGRTKKQIPLRFTHRERLKDIEPGNPEPWYQLDLAYIHCYLIDRLLTEHLGHAPEVRYTKSEAIAHETAAHEAGVALLVKATPMDQLRALSQAGGLMPQKTTFFYPKVATGLTINSLA